MTTVAPAPADDPGEPVFAYGVQLEDSDEEEGGEQLHYDSEDSDDDPDDASPDSWKEQILKRVSQVTIEDDPDF